MIRPFERADVPAVRRLHQKVFGHQTMMDRDALERHFVEVFFDNPWADASVASYVWHKRGSPLAGFVGVLPLHVTHEGQMLRAASPAQLMVDHEHVTPFAAAQLLKRLFADDYDLLFTDGANDLAASLWKACRGERAWLHGLRWTRSLRPAQELARWMGHRRSFTRVLTRMASPIAAAADEAFALVKPNLFRQVVEGLRDEPISAATMAEGWKSLPREGGLRPEYDVLWLEWMLDRLREKERFGALRAKIIREEKTGLLIGWYLYFTRHRGTSRVVQLVSRPNREYEVLSHLFRDAWRSGAVAIEGGVDANLLPALTSMHCRLAAGAPWSLCYSPRLEVLDTIRRGDALLGRLDMEYWMRFIGG